MRDAVDLVLQQLGGVASRTRLLTVVTPGQLDDEIRRNHLTRVFRRVYCRPWDADLPETAVRGALLSAGAAVALSHLSAAHRWGLLDRPAEVHVSIPSARALRAQPGLRVHRVTRFPPLVRLEGLVTTTAAASVVTSWPLSRGPDQPAVAIAAARQGLVTPTDLTAELGRQPRLPGRAELTRLAALLAAGCESELEIWGHLHVFDVPGLRHGVRQHRLELRGRRLRVDLAFVDERVAVEMDGERWHAGPDERERDRRRDSALASIGWVTLRFSHRRLHSDISGCRSETLACLARRR